jgi:hypothetical protein
MAETKRTTVGTGMAQWSFRCWPSGPDALGLAAARLRCFERHLIARGGAHQRRDRRRVVHQPEDRQRPRTNILRRLGVTKADPGGSMAERAGLLDDVDRR